MNIATMLDASSGVAIANDSADMATLLESINDNLELFILLFALFKCIELVRIGFGRLYKGKGV